MARASPEIACRMFSTYSPARPLALRERLPGWGSVWHSCARSSSSMAGTWKPEAADRGVEAPLSYGSPCAIPHCRCQSHDLTRQFRRVVAGHTCPVDTFVGLLLALRRVRCG